MAEWQMTQETGKLKGKPIPIWHVAPKPYQYGFASFSAEDVAREYLKWVNGEKQKSSPT